ncbi:MAG: DHHA1 domain-containing protein, partial [Methanobacteriota archaeon]
EVAKGDRSGYYKAMLSLLRQHRSSIAKGMEFIEEGGLKRGPKGYLQYFDATGLVKSMFVGTIASLALGNVYCDPYKPIVGVVRENGSAKIAARCSRLLFLRGFDMSKAIRAAASASGGEGGGHAVACGAEIRDENVKKFLEKFEELLVAQLTGQHALS